MRGDSILVEPAIQYMMVQSKDMASLAGGTSSLGEPEFAESSTRRRYPEARALKIVASRTVRDHPVPER